MVGSKFIFAVIVIWILPQNGDCNAQPRFSSPVLVIQTTEQLPVDTLIGVVKATDADGDQIIYDLKVPNEYFKIEEFTGGIVIVKIVDKEQLDSDTITLTAQAFDVVDPTRKTSITVLIHVQDVNDNLPRFTNLPYSTSISEKAKVGDFVYKVSAVDLDTTSELLFYISSGNERGIFNIDIYSGDITLEHELDYANKTTHHLNISVEDSRPSDLSRNTIYTLLTVNVIDEDDHGAVFNRSKYIGFVKEGILQNEYILSVSASDKDIRQGEEIIFGIDEDPSGLFQINPNSGVITASGSTENENGKVYKLTMKCQSTFPNISYAELEITVDNEEAKKPHFELGLFEASMLVTDPLGTPIVKTKLSYSRATDDFQIELKILSGGLPYLGIDDTGTIRKQVAANVSLPSEQNIVIGFYNPVGKLTSVNVRLYLNPDQTKPLFREGDFEASIFENEEANFPVTAVFAMDGYEKDIIYSLESGITSFKIHSVTGHISTAKPLDRETQATHTFNVYATNKYDQTRIASKQVTVLILDINDNEPVFSSQEYRLKAYKGTPQNTVIAKIEAIDTDESANGEVTYKVSTDNSNGLVSVNHRNGTVTLSNPLGTIVPGTVYAIEVTATDGGGPSKSSKVDIKLEVQESEELLFIRSRRIDIENNIDLFTRDIQQMTGKKTMIKSLIIKHNPPTTDLEFFAINTTTSIAIPRTQLNSLMTDAFLVNDFFFTKWNITIFTYPENMLSKMALESSGREWHLTAYIVIGLSILVLILALIAAAKVIAARNKRRKQESNFTNVAYNDKATDKASSRYSPEPELKYDTENGDPGKQRVSVFSAHPFYGRPPSVAESNSTIPFESGSVVTVWRNPIESQHITNTTPVGSQQNSFVMLSPEMADNPLNSKLSYSVNDLETIRITDAADVNKTLWQNNLKKTDC